MEGAEGAGAGAGLQAPYLLDIAVAVRPGKFHLYQREAVDEHRIGARFTASGFFQAESDVHFMGLFVLVLEPLSFLIAQQVPPYILGDQFHLIVDGAVAGHFALMAVIPKGPPRDADGPPLTKILNEIGI